jgi:hypothetical protein
MFKWLYKIRYSNSPNFDINNEQENLRRARYQFIGALVLFVSILFCAPFLIKKPPTDSNKAINMRLIHDNEQENLDNMKNNRADGLSNSTQHKKQQSNSNNTEMKIFHEAGI